MMYLWERTSLAGFVEIWISRNFDVDSILGCDEPEGVPRICSSATETAYSDCSDWQEDFMAKFTEESFLLIQRTSYVNVQQFIVVSLHRVRLHGLSFVPNFLFLLTVSISLDYV